jgi:DNA-binding PadR family transcriptional regulator
MTLSSDLLRGYTDAVILARLKDRDGYGYQISKEVAEISGGYLELKEATLYTAFRRLEASGCIRSYWGNEAVGARRRYYTLTEEGARRLAEETATWAETRRVLNALLEGSDPAAQEEKTAASENPVPQIVLHSGPDQTVSEEVKEEAL